MDAGALDAALLLDHDVDRELEPPAAPRSLAQSLRRPLPRAALTGPVTGPALRAPSAPSPRRVAGRGSGEIAPAAPRPPPRAGGVVYPAPSADDAARPIDDAALPKPPAEVHLSPRMTAIFGGIFGLATVTSLVALLIQGSAPRNDRAITAGTAGSASASVGAAPSDGPRAEPPPVKKRVRVSIPGPWRLAELEKEPGVTIERGTMDKRSLFEALGEKVPKAEVYRILKSLDGIKTFDKSRKKDRFAVAMAGKKVKAFEYEVSPSEIYQAREGADGLLTGAKLDMKLAQEEYAGSFYVGSDVAASYRAAGFEDGILAALDEALSGHMSTEGFEEGGTVRVLAVEETALGQFSRYKRILAMEYRPPDPAGKPVRVYGFDGQEAHGYWDDKGHQPNAGGWRMPCPGAPVTSHFNPKRMHPVLHTIMPHTGTDFGAPMGAPIYSAYKGVVESAGPLGPCGNAVVINHPGGITTGYCHMSRFGNVKAGDHVGTHQLVGYVGKTGRATGPHLHFFAKKGGVFFDAMTLHLDGDRPVPVVDRGAFLAAKAELDKRLDAIALPDPPPEPEKPAAVAAASGSVDPGEPAAPGKEPTEPKDGKEPKDSKEPRESKDGKRRTASQIGSPEALAAARAEPGIHPSQLAEVKGDEDEDVSPPTGSPTPPPSGKKGKPEPGQPGQPGRRPDPAVDDDDEK
jgi:murein DD-endopeptidase MepM/ murein hydrolase activator NlpD